MSDLIDRQTAIDAVGDWIYNPEDLRYHKDVINSIPAVQPDHNADSDKMADGDCISRQAAIYAIVNTPSKVGYHDNSEVARYGATFRQHEILDIIERLSSIQPERKRGEWINEGRIIRCNKCKIGYAVVKGMKSAIMYKFCPNCGADMRGEQDG